MSIVATCVDLLAQISCVFYLFKIFLALIVWDLFHDTLLLKLFGKYFCDTMKIKIPTYILELDIRFISKKMYLEQVLTHDYCLMMMM